MNNITTVFSRNNTKSNKIKLEQQYLWKSHDYKIQILVLHIIIRFVNFLFFKFFFCFCIGVKYSWTLVALQQRLVIILCPVFIYINESVVTQFLIILIEVTLFIVILNFFIYFWVTKQLIWYKIIANMI